MEVARAGPHREIQRRNRFDVVVEHVRPRCDHRFERAILAEKIRRQNFDRGLRAPRANGANDLSEMVGAAVIEIVAVDRCDHDVGEPKLRGRVRDMFRLVRIKCTRQAGLDVAERAGARAGVTHHHEGGVLLLPALADIGAAGLFADGDETLLAQNAAGLGKGRGTRRLDANPVRLTQHRRIRTVRLFRVARRKRVENDGHDADGGLCCSLGTSRGAVAQDARHLRPALNSGPESRPAAGSR